MSPLSLDSRQLDGNVFVLSVAGEVDATNSDQLQSCLARLCGPGRRLVLDLSRLTFLDSSGLRVLLTAHAGLQQQGALLLADVHDTPAHLLQVTGVWDALIIHPSVEQAIAAAQDGPTAPMREAP
ncbi:STAS domain-containing protein [Nonomuraea sp. GTA35]|uniref:STAS domain-containing protein n=1 Tax=Nonomuraea sp. GTA35 TaxID=1676746 RepID=UPI0035C257B6